MTTVAPISSSNPSSSADETELQLRRSQMARSITRTAVWIAGGTALIALLARFVLPYDQLLIYAGALGFTALVSGLYPLLDRRGHGRLGRTLFFFAALLDVATFSLLIPQMLPSTVGAFVIVLAMSYLLLGERDSIWLIAVSMAGFVAIYLLLQGNQFPWSLNVGEPWGTYIAIFGGISTIFAAVLIVRMIISGQETAIREARRAAIEIEQRAAIEREQRERLEKANQEIERQAAARQEQQQQLLLLLGQIRGAARQLAVAANQILVATAQQVSGATEQSTAIGQVSMTIEEIRTIAQQTSRRAQEVADVAQRTAAVSQVGQQAVAATVTGVGVVKHKVELIATNILALSEQSQAIAQIIATVRDIATQSNRLALNAAIEAARAGEAGRSFAVVAQEVRMLAERSRTATEQVGEILAEVQRGIGAAVMATEEGVKGADEGVDLAGSAGKAIDQLIESVAGSAGAAEQIAGAANQQQAGLEQMAQAMGSIHEVTARSVTRAEQSEQAASALNRLAGQLQELAEQYQA